MLGKLAFCIAVSLPSLAVLSASGDVPTDLSGNEWLVVLRYGVPGVLAVLMGLLTYIVRTLFQSHLKEMKKIGDSVTIQARASLIIADELRRRPCMCSSQKMREMAETQTREDPISTEE